MTLNDLYCECEKNHIEVYPFKMQSGLKGIALPSGNIGLDLDRISNTIEEKEILAHEECHILGGFFYNIYSDICVKEQQEYRATVATIKKLVPKNELEEAINCGLTEHWELADYFDVSNKFMKSALKYYKEH